MEKNYKKNWMKYPTKKQAILVFSAWLFVIVASIFLKAELFTLNPLKAISTSLFSAHLPITVIVLAVCVSYFRNKHKATI